MVRRTFKSYTVTDGKLVLRLESAPEVRQGDRIDVKRREFERHHGTAVRYGSSLTIVPLPWPLVIVAPVGAESVTENVSFPSWIVSPTIGTLIARLLTKGGKLSVPDLSA